MKHHQHGPIKTDVQRQQYNYKNRKDPRRQKKKKQKNKKDKKDKKNKCARINKFI